MNVKDLKTDKKYKDIFPITEEECKAMELLALNDGEVYQPLIVWKGQDVLVYGYHYLEILKAHPDVKHTIRELEFEDWQEAQVWAIEHYIAQPEVRLWQKLEAAVKCESYWLLKGEAKKAKGKRTDLSSVSEDRSDGSKEVNAIIAQKVGCGVTYVYNFKRILSSGRIDIIKMCRKGELMINGAYARLFLPKKQHKSKPGPDVPIELDIDGADIFEECEKNINVGTKNTNRSNGIPVDPNPVAEKMKTAKVPDGAIWIALHKKDRQIQVTKKTFDELRGNNHISVNSYNCKVIATDNDTIILEADHINGSAQILVRKEDSEFEDLSRKAS